MATNINGSDSAEIDDALLSDAVVVKFVVEYSDNDVLVVFIKVVVPGSCDGLMVGANIG